MCTDADHQKSLVTQKPHCDNLVKRRFLVAPGFEIYGGSAGLYDYGPNGCAIKVKLEQKWRDHFVINEGLFEVCCTNLTPHAVFKASGHIDRFTDYMVLDSKSGDFFRADKFLEEFVESVKQKTLKPKSHKAYKLPIEELEDIYVQAGTYTASQLDSTYANLAIKSPLGNEFTEAVPFNLMFKTAIGPKASSDTNSIAYLRPETAQGIFLNFKRLYEQNYNRLPFGAAQIGDGFRNEISPKNGLIRAREFRMAEIEYFVDPQFKSKHKRFRIVKDVEVSLYSAKHQEANEPAQMTSIGQAVESGMVGNENLGYFMGRTFAFLCSVGIKKELVRFRQHMSNEMAHYASDCWDAEVLCSHGWVECVGHADRSAYDLECHAKASGMALEASRMVTPPRLYKYVKAEINAKLLGPRFKKEATKVKSLLEELSDEDKIILEAQLAKGDVEKGGFSITRDLVSFEWTEKMIHEETFTPHVIEPSFGIGRIFHMILEHTFESRNIEGQEARNFLRLPLALAPYTCVLLPISQNEKFNDILDFLSEDLTKDYISCKVDSSASNIGKRYARTDELGVPFAVTVDFQSLEDDTVTIRERDGMTQIRVSKSEVKVLLIQFMKSTMTDKNSSTNWCNMDFYRDNVVEVAK